MTIPSVIQCTYIGLHSYVLVSFTPRQPLISLTYSLQMFQAWPSCLFCRLCVSRITLFYVSLLLCPRSILFSRPGHVPAMTVPSYMYTKCTYIGRCYFVWPSLCFFFSLPAQRDSYVMYPCSLFNPRSYLIDLFPDTIAQGGAELSLVLDNRQSWWISYYFISMFFPLRFIHLSQYSFSFF